ncbi:MAG: hypothetical protein K8R76_10845 [Candidatus Aegiribacteria sp.]|nr:hypothetical protein [Candidatus Aegiribacteria sp.]
MRFHTSVISVIVLFMAGISSAALPRIGVVSIDSDDFAPDNSILETVRVELIRSGRFEVVDLDSVSYLNVSPDLLINRLQTIASEENLDIFLALEIPAAEEYDRTSFRNDSLITYRTVTVNVLGRFYTSAGTLIGTIRNTVSREEMLPFVPDRYRLALTCAEQLAARSILELFPLEVTFIASDSQIFSIPIGREQGISNGMIMAAVAASSGIPEDLSEYEALRSRGLLQISDVGNTQSSARLLSGHLVNGGAVTAIEQSAPAIMYIEYNLLSMKVERGEGLEGTDSDWSSNIRLGVETGKWGLSFGGGLRAGGLEHSSSLGVDFLVGTRIPLSSPSLGLRLSGGGEAIFLMQDVRSDTLASNSSAICVAAIADASLEYLFSNHLGIQFGISGVLGTAAENWTVQEYSGKVRDANPDEIYYTKMEHGPFNIHAGLIWMIF